MSIQRLIGALLLAIGLTNMVMAADSRPDVAQIINKTEASAILGEPVKDPSQRSGDGTDGYYSKCNYYSVRRGKSLIIGLQVPVANAIGRKKELQLLAAENGTMEQVSNDGVVATIFNRGIAGGCTALMRRLLH